ncbi:MAG: dTDP-4-dehydrorhamnose 3,5-epimerase [Bacteroidota bacterium]|nr:dTDP-4-dehydrorhamnose 3,5-epimerase [Bacteroidota bacterium]
MTFESTGLAGSYVITLHPIRDERGWFVRTFCKNEFAEIGHKGEWVQMNHSFTNDAGTIRGMHFQQPPFSEIKLLRCVAGKVFDVIVDLRKNSETFLHWFGAELSADNYKMIYIPQGFAHGFQALSDNCQLIYNHTDYYTPGHEDGIKYNDEMINIEWPMPVTIISERDNNHPLLNHNFEGLNIL